MHGRAKARPYGIRRDSVYGRAKARPYGTRGDSMHGRAKARPYGIRRDSVYGRAGGSPSLASKCPTDFARLTCVYLDLREGPEKR